jgi:hypothetical protein
MPGPRPQLVALLLCDRAFQEAGSLKWCIIGAFDTILAPQLPFRAPPMTVFVALSDFTGNAMVKVVIRNEEGAVVVAVRGKPPAIPVGLFQYAFPLTEVELRDAGVHTLELFVEDDLLALRSFRVQHGAAEAAQEQGQAAKLTETHLEQLVKDAREVWAEHPEAQPVGLIVSAQAGESPWFRQAFESVFGSPPPQMTFVGLLDRETSLRLLGDKAPPDQDWLAKPPDHDGHVLPVLIVMRGGFQLTIHKVE